MCIFCELHVDKLKAQNASHGVVDNLRVFLSFCGRYSHRYKHQKLCLYNAYHGFYTNPQALLLLLRNLIILFIYIFQFLE